MLNRLFYLPLLSARDIILSNGLSAEDSAMKKTARNNKPNNNNNDVLFFKFDEIMPRNTPVFPRVSKNELTPLHRHDYIEFFYTLEGSGIHVLNGRRESVTAGDACVLTPNDVHGFNPVADKSTKHMDICVDINYFKQVCDFFSPTLTNEFLKGNGMTFELSAEKIAKFEQYVPNLFLSTGENAYRVSAKILTSMIIELIFAFHSEQKPAMPEWIFGLLAEFNSRANFQTPLSDITKKFNYNADYMRRVFKQYTGLNMTDYFNNQKMDYAYTLLSTTKLPIESICEAIGLNNISYFYHLFKSIYNKTPNEIRKRP